MLTVSAGQSDSDVAGGLLTAIDSFEYLFLLTPFTLGTPFLLVHFQSTQASR